MLVLFVGMVFFVVNVCFFVWFEFVCLGFVGSGNGVVVMVVIVLMFKGIYGIMLFIVKFLVKFF